MKYHLRACGTMYRGCAPECKYHDYHSDEKVIERNRMRQVSYEFSLAEVATFLASNTDPTPNGVRPYLEDGYWELIPLIETTSPVLMPALFAQQKQETLPSVISRLVGIKLQKTNAPNDLCIQIRYGKVISQNGPDTDQRGLQESSGSAGEDSPSTGESYALPGNSGFRTFDYRRSP